MKYHTENFGKTFEFRSKRHKEFLIESHIHEFSEILYCKSGTAQGIVNGRNIFVPAGHLIFIPPNYVHEYQCRNTDVVCAVFSNDFIPCFWKELKNRRILCTPVDFSQYEEIILSFPGIDSTCHTLICGYLNLICSGILTSSAFEEPMISDSVLYQKVITYISENFLQEIRLKDIANKFGYNEKYLSHALHSLTGIHFNRLISMYRINYAKELFDKNSEISVTEVASACGFSAQNTFNRAFKDFTNQTPSQYRQKH